MDDSVQVDCFIVVEQVFKEQYGGIRAVGRPGIRVTKSKPALARNEVPIRISISIPRAYWVRPEIHASVTLPDIQNDPSLKLTVAEEVGRQISESMGMKVDIKVVTPEESA